MQQPAPVADDTAPSAAEVEPPVAEAETIAEMILGLARDVLPLLGVIAGSILVLAIVDRLIRRRMAVRKQEARFAHQVTMLALTGAAIILVILTIPVTDEVQGQLLGLLGLLTTAVIGLASATFVSNAISGLMLRSMRHFRPGDFLRCGDHFGRVTERGLFHTEIQTEDRDLTTLPNYYLISNPSTVVRESGTILSGSISLGYDVSRARIEQALAAAAEDVGLREPFVRIMELGDFSIQYRVSGMLEDVKQIVSARSRLLKAMVDRLHQADIEIVSPTFMYQRPQEPGTHMIPRDRSAPHDDDGDAPPEQIIFDKAEEAERFEELRAELARLTEERKRLKGEIADADADAKAGLQRDAERAERRAAAIERMLDRHTEAEDQA